LEEESIIFSYHYKYEKYLRDFNLIDVSKFTFFELLVVATKSKIIRREIGQKKVISFSRFK
jgi:hypothetical protein